MLAGEADGVSEPALVTPTMTKLEKIKTANTRKIIKREKKRDFEIFLKNPRILLIITTKKSEFV